MKHAPYNLSVILLCGAKLWCKYLLLLLVVFGSDVAYAHAREIDSLRAELSSSTSDAERILLLSELSSKLKSIDLNESLVHINNALTLARQIKDKENEAKALYHKGILVYDTAERDSALWYFEAGEQLAETLGLGELQTKSLMKIAKWYRYHRVDSTKAVNYFLKSLEISKAINYDYGTGRSYAKLASFYTKYHQIELCETYLKFAAEYYTKAGNSETAIAHYYNEVGDKIWDFNPRKSMDLFLKGLEHSENYPGIKINLAKAYNFIGEPQIALSYLKEAIPPTREMNNIRILGIAIAQLAEVYIQLEDYKAANKTCDEGISLLTPLGRSNQKALPALYRAKAIIAEYEGKDTLALEFYKKSIEEAIRIKHKFGRIKSELFIGKFYLSYEQEKAKKVCNKALKSAKKNSYTNIEVEACDCLYLVYKAENASAKALEYYEQKIALSDSMSTLKLKHALDINREISLKDRQLAEQDHQKEIRDEQLKNQYRLSTILFLSFLGGLFLIGFLLLSLKRIRKQNIEITKKTEDLKSANLSLGRSNEELERFAYIASHDLKSPLRNIISFTGLLRRALDKEVPDPPSIQQFLGFIELNGKRMSQLIEDILEYSKFSNQHARENQTSIINLNKLVNEITQIILNKEEAQLINIEASNLPSLKWNSSKIYLLFKNLIENALKYNEAEEPMVKLSFTNTGGVNTIYVEDNGIGIKKEYFDKIFVMFQRLHTQEEYEGTGLGLATCKKIVNEFEGRISLQSELGKGTIFKIELPDHLIYHPVDVELLVSS